MLLANVYGPNTDSPAFFENIANRLESISCESKIIAGDFNCVLDNKLDKKGGRSEHKNKKAQTFINSWIEECDLLDIWRNMHPNEERFTYHQLKPIPVFSRLDFFLISMGLCGFINHTNIKPGFCTDHSIIEMSISLLSHPRGRGFWKFNETLLNDINYVREVR